MRRHTSTLITAGLVAVTAGLVAVFGILRIPHAAAQPPMPPVYNPYPPGILPGDINTEIARVQREITFIFKEALGEAALLPPPNLQGNPPTLQGSGYQSVEVLGKLMNFDLNISPFKDEACASCHMPYAGFSGPIRQL
jgi:hypothetical protein